VLAAIAVRLTLSRIVANGPPKRRDPPRPRS
jgi:hypothetical protein